MASYDLDQPPQNGDGVDRKTEVNILLLMKIYLSALGCKLNQSEMESLARQFLAAGHQVVSAAEEADICVLNTCTVTHIAARKSRQAWRHLRRVNPRAFLVVTGCHAEISPHELGNRSNKGMVVGNADKERVLALLQERIPALTPTDTVALVEAPGSLPLERIQRAVSRTRAFVKIQDGCDNACTYCIVPKARGRAMSRPSSQIIEEIRQRSKEGYKEVVLTGVHIGAYGRQTGDSLSRLVQAILRETDLPRLRLSSIEPWDFSTDLLPLWHSTRLCRHLHLPLQSGCDATLRRMGRKYTAEQYAEILSLARAHIPDLAVTTDIIVGFPGETEAEFAASLDFVKRQAFSRLHIFQYSPRPDTVAASMSGQIPPAVKEARSDVMRQVGKETAERFQRSFLGRTFAVLWEAEETPQGPTGLSVWSGLTDNYIRVLTESAKPLANIIVPVRLICVQSGYVWTEL